MGENCHLFGILSADGLDRYLIDARLIASNGWDGVFE